VTICAVSVAKALLEESLLARDDRVVHDEQRRDGRREHGWRVEHQGPEHNNSWPMSGLRVKRYGPPWTSAVGCESGDIGVRGTHEEPSDDRAERDANAGQYGAGC